MILISYNGHAINDGTNYASYLEPSSHNAPEMKGVRIGRTNADSLVGNVENVDAYKVIRTTLQTTTSASTKRELQQQWLRWFWPKNRTAGALVWADDDGSSNQRYVMCYPEQVIYDSDGDGLVMQTVLAVHGERVARAGTATTVSASLTASGQTVAVSNGTAARNDFARPKITLTATGAKSSGNGNVYQRFLAVPWAFGRGGRREPVDIANAALDTRIATTNFASATGDDIRVYVDGVAVDFWLAAPNTAATKLWVNLDFAAGVSLTLDGGVNSSADSLVFAEGVESLPAAGILHFTGNNEVVTYTAKNNATKTVTGVSRGAKGSTAATQSDGAAVAWVQHDVWVTYGDGSLAAYVPDDVNKPAFDVSSSTNTSWVYSGVFGDDGRLRSGGWQPGGGIGGNTADAGYCYTRDHSGGSGSETTTPWDAVGLAQTDEGETRWVLYSPRGISAANFSAGKKYTATAAAAASFAAVQSASNGNDWVTESAIAATTAGNSWQTWSANVTGLYTANSKETKYVALRIAEGADDAERYKVQATAVTVTLQSGVATVILGELDAYSSDIVITNSTTGYGLRLRLPVPLNEGVEIDTELRTVVLLGDNKSVLDALTILGGVREEWLALAAGSNTLTVTEAGLTGLDVDVEFYARYYD